MVSPPGPVAPSPDQARAKRQVAAGATDPRAQVVLVVVAEAAQQVARNH
jgi:hypothetical protein